MAPPMNVQSTTEFNPAPIPAFYDNYLWLLAVNGQAIVVDPGAAQPVLDYLRQHGLHLAGILLTHHHADHIGGVKRIIDEFNDVPVWGPDDSRIPAQARTVGQGDRVRIDSMGLNLQVLAVPGHTRSHIAYYGHDLLFCGDTLFSVGCGRLFEGTPGQMQESLDKLAALPSHTRVYAAHEYTQDNCRFALQVEPDNPALLEYADRVQKNRQANRPTLPSTIGRELACNPFMRSREPSVIAAAQQREPVCGDEPAAVLGVIRRWKDRF